MPKVAKTVTITAAEYDYIMETIAHDGMELARLEAENARLKQLLEAKGGETWPENTGIGKSR